MGVDFSLPQAWLLPDLLPSSKERLLANDSPSCPGSTGDWVWGQRVTSSAALALAQGVLCSAQGRGANPQQDGEELICSLQVFSEHPQQGWPGPGRSQVPEAGGLGAAPLLCLPQEHPAEQEGLCGIPRTPRGCRREQGWAVAGTEGPCLAFFRNSPSEVAFVTLEGLWGFGDAADAERVGHHSRGCMLEKWQLPLEQTSLRQIFLS